MKQYGKNAVGDSYYIVGISAEGDMVYSTSNNDDGSILSIVTWNATNGNKIWSTGIVFAANDYFPSVMVPLGDGSNIMFYGAILFQFVACNGQGVCTAPGSACECFDNYFTDDCLVFCNSSECGEMSHGNGACSNETGICGCFENYYPEGDCTVFCDNDACSSSGHASCTSLGVCACHSQYYGSTCNTFCDNSKTCNDNGVCNEKDGSCSCSTTYAGTTCSMRSGGVIAGAIIGALAGVLIIGGLFYWWRRSKRGQYQEIEKKN